MSEHPMISGDEGLFCPGCGYDLRMTEGRCPECGREFEKATLNVSRIAWEHRRHIGRMRAWRRTVWMVLWHPGDAGVEVARPLDWISAKRFSWVTIWVIAVWTGIISAALYAWMPLKDFSVEVRPMWSLEVRNPLEYPIYALWTGPGLIAVWVAAMAAGGGAAMWWMRLSFWILGGRNRQRASAVACYGSAFGIVIALLLTAGLGLWVAAPHLKDRREPAQLWFGITFDVVLAFLLLFTWFGLIRMLHQATGRRGIGTGLGAVIMPIGGLAAFALVAFIVNYIMGLVALIWASLGG